MKDFVLTVENEGGDTGIHRLIAKCLVDKMLVEAFKCGCESGNPNEHREAIIARVFERMGSE